MTDLARLTTDDLWPRDNPAYRYRLYLWDGADLAVACACADPGAVGVALVVLTDEGESICGVLDVQPGGRVCETGTWIVSPFAATPFAQ